MIIENIMFSTKLLFPAKQIILKFICTKYYNDMNLKTLCCGNILYFDTIGAWYN